MVAHKHPYPYAGAHITVEMAQLAKGPYVRVADTSSDLQHLCKKLCLQRHRPLYSRHCGDGHRRTPGAFWLASLAERESSGVRERPCLEKNKTKLESSHHQPLASMCHTHRKDKEKYINYE